MARKKKKHMPERISFTLTSEMKSELDRLSAKQRIPVSELIRKYVERGMHIEKNKDDIDFIRKQIREELNPIVKYYMDRIIKLLMRIGIMTVSLCFFTSKILFILVKKHKDNADYDVMFNDAKKRARAYLSVRDEEVEQAYTQVLGDTEDNL